MDFRGLRRHRREGPNAFAPSGKMPPAVRGARGWQQEQKYWALRLQRMSAARAQGRRSTLTRDPVICCFSRLASTTESELAICVTAKSPTSNMPNRDKPSRSENPRPESPTSFINRSVYKALRGHLEASGGITIMNEDYLFQSRRGHQKPHTIMTVHRPHSHHAIPGH